MRIVVALLLSTAALAQSLALAPERALVLAAVAHPNGYVNLTGAASDGERVLFVWWRIGSGGADVRYWSFDGEKPRPLPLHAYETPIGVVWSGASYFVVVISNHGSGLLSIDRTGNIGKMLKIDLDPQHQSAIAANGDGFMIVNGNRALFFDRAGKPARTIELPPIGTNVSVAASDDDYAVASAASEFANEVTLLTIHDDGTITKSSLPIRIEYSRSFKLAWDGTRFVASVPDRNTPLAVVQTKKKPVLVTYTDNPPALHATDDMLVTDVTSDQSFLTASNEGTHAFVAWIENSRIVATVFDTRSLDAPRTKIDVDAAGDHAVLSAISTGGMHMLVWRDVQKMKVMRFDASGAKRDAQPIELGAGRANGFGDMPALLRDGNQVLAVWTDNHNVRALRIPLAGAIRPQTPFTIHHDEATASFAPQLRGDGVKPVLYWFTQPIEHLYDTPARPFDLRSAIIRGARARVNPPLASKLLYPQKLAFDGNRILWPEYRVPFYGPWPRPEKLPPQYVDFHAAALAANGTLTSKPRVVKTEEFAGWTAQPATDLSIVHAAGKTFAVWTEEGTIVAMQLEPDGDAVAVGTALTNTLHALETPAGPLFVYTRRGEGSEQIMIAASR